MRFRVVFCSVCLTLLWSCSLSTARKARLTPAKPDEHYKAEKAFASGLQRETSGAWEEAYQDYTTALQFSPEYADAWRHRGQVEFARANYQKAIDDENNCLHT